jgi:MSHA biogenesis protein MshO
MAVPARPAQTGFTLVEAIMVIVITGVIAGMVAVFIKAPVDSYFDSVRRAELTDLADTAVRRIARDVRLALPNSVRNPDGADQCVEFMPTKIGGRYRSVVDSAGSGDALDFTAADDAFDMLWLNTTLPAAQRLAVGDVVVVYNDGSPSGNAYTGANAIRIASLTEPGGTAGSTGVGFVDAATGSPFQRKQLPSESPYHRFQVVPNNEHVVAYVCSGGTLYRLSRTLTAAYPLPSPAACPAVTPGTTPVLATNVSACSLRYEPPGSGSGLSRNGIVVISLEITQAGESVRLYHQVHVDNTP